MAETSRTKETVKHSWDRILVLVLLSMLALTARACEETRTPDVYWEEAE